MKRFSAFFKTAILAAILLALCRLVWKLTSQATVDKHVVFGRSGLHRIAWQVLEF